MSTFEFSAGISIRAYGSITVEADDMEAAIKIINDPDFDMGEHFSPNGGGDDDYSFDFAFPAVNLMAVVVDDDIDTEEEIDRHPRLPNELITDAAPALLDALKSAVVFANNANYLLAGQNVEPSVSQQWLDAIAKAEGK